MRPLDHLHPSVFLAVMAPAAVSISAATHGHAALSRALLWAAVALLAATTLVAIARIATAPEDVRAALASPGTLFASFTLVAGLAVLGDAFALRGHALPTLGLWAAGAFAWVLLAYGTALSVILARAGSVEEWVVPSWAYPVVATQTLVATATALSSQWWPTFFLFVGLTAFLLAWGLFLLLGGWIGQRLVFDRVEPGDLGPQHWIPMGALAASGLAATRLVSTADRYELVEATRPVIEAFAVTAWAGCTAWLVLIAGIEAWRVRRLGPRAVVAPGAFAVAYAVGIYSAATWEISRVYDLPVAGYSTVVFWLAVAGLAWAVVATAWWALRLRRGA